MSEKPFANKVAVVTGAARGIGRAIAEHLAEWGAAIAIVDVNQEQCEATAREIASKYGVQALGVQCNVTKKEDVEAAVDKIKGELKTINFVVNNAGVTRDTLMMRMKEEDWDLVMDVNLKGAFLVSQAALRLLMKAETPRIVNISSISGLLGQVGQTNYSSSKAGLLGFTKAFAREYASKGITCNAVCPGFINTEMTAAMTDQAKEASLQMIPMGRAGEVEDIARVVRFLCSEDAGYVTGVALRVDGGAATGI